MRILSRQHHGSVESDRLIVDLHLHIFIEGFLEAASDDAVVLESEQFERVDSKLAPDLLDKIFPLTILAFFEPLQILELAILNRWQEITEFFFVEGSAADSEHHKQMPVDDLDHGVPSHEVELRDGVVPELLVLAERPLRLRLKEKVFVEVLFFRTATNHIKDVVVLDRRKILLHFFSVKIKHLVRLQLLVSRLIVRVVERQLVDLRRTAPHLLVPVKEEAQFISDRFLRFVDARRARQLHRRIVLLKQSSRLTFVDELHIDECNVLLELVADEILDKSHLVRLVDDAQLLLLVDVEEARPEQWIAQPHGVRWRRLGGPTARVMRLWLVLGLADRH